MRLIDADALVKRTEEFKCDWNEKTAPYSLNHAYDSFIDIIDEQPTVGGWISVNDRLPELHIAVLGYAPYRKNIWAVTMHDDQSWYIWQPSLSKKYEPEWDGPITHWMPLPSTEGLHET